MFLENKSCTLVVLLSELRGLPLLAEFAVDLRFRKFRSYRRLVLRAESSLFILVRTQAVSMLWIGYDGIQQVFVIFRDLSKLPQL